MNLDASEMSGGLNIWVMSSARKCQIAGLTTFEAENRIMAFQGQGHRPIKATEVRRAIEKAYATTLPDSPSFKAKKAAWVPAATRTTSHKTTPKKLTKYDLWEASPDRLDDGITQGMILNWLFPDPAGLVCVGKSAFEFHTARLDQFKDLTQCQFIVPCYMTKRKGLTQEGKPSMHCLDNCGERRFCVCDFDEPKSDDHPSIIWHLRKIADLVMVLSSGGKSLHAWFNVPADEEEAFWKAAVKHGADPALMRNRSSFVRMPMGTRDNGKNQTVVYFDHTKII